jgi:phosphocarrier protein
MNKGRSPTRAGESPRASKDAPLTGRAGESMSPRTGGDPRAGTPAGATRPEIVLTRQAIIRNQRGLHARAAARFVKLAGQFDAALRVSRGGQTVSGHSIMGLMMLAAGPGMDLEIEARGPEAQAALDAIGALIESGFDEKD